eukprot:TRINITY_DN5411_c0_g1_i6.p1 TRINITY_DN5411_c0_g1~~TRINITY_DN5411_c0_g1_i6.p1  ORF type:complete len:112 (+),score=22.66 TRINITY_DN5411_c0_g1_i6:105-440(+)
MKCRWFVFPEFNVFKVKKGQTAQQEGRKLFNYADFPQVEKFIRAVVNENPKNRYALSTLVIILVSAATKESLTEALELIGTLQTEADLIRTNYWKWFSANIEADFGSLLKA